MRKNSIFGYIYLLIWGAIIFIFCKDFFYLDEIKRVDFLEILNLLKISFNQAITSVIFSIFVALFPAYYISYTEGRLTKLLESLYFIPFFFPTVPTIIAFTIIFNLPHLRNLNILYSFSGIIIANVFYNSPIIMKYLSKGLKSISKEIVETARLDGASDFYIFLKIKLPLISLQLFRGAFIVFIYSFLSFTVVLALGGIKYSNFEVEIANTLTKDGDFTKGLLLGLFQFFFILGINMLEKIFPTYEIMEKGYQERLNPIFSFISIVYLIFEYGVIIVGTLYGFFNYYTNSFTLKNFIKLFSEELNREFPVIKSIFNTFLLSSLVPILVIVFAYILLKNYNRMIDIIVFSTMGVSSSFLGVILIYLNIVYDINIYIILGLGYFLFLLPLANSFMYQYIKGFPKEILELAEVDGLNSFQKFIYIEFPILKNILITTYFQLFAIIWGEFTIGYTMQIGTVFPTVSIVNYALYSNKKMLEAGAFSSLNILIISILFFISSNFENRDEK